MILLCRADQPGLRKTGTAPEDFVSHGARPLLGTMPNLIQHFLFYPWDFSTQALPQDACFVGGWPLHFLFLELCPLSFLSCAHFENPLSALAGLWPWWVWPPLILPGLCPLQAGSLWCFAPMALPSLYWTPLGIYYMLDHPGLRRIWITPDGFYHPQGYAIFMD
jgi:hypothetical protein